jgi:hypothetical protein
MPETDALTRCLHELGDLGANQLRTESVRSRVRLAVDHEVDAEQSGRSARRPRQVRIRISRGALVSAVCVLVAVAVVVGALTLVSGGSNRPSQPAANPGARALIARLAVLRRPQTPADHLPAHLNLVGVSGTIVPGLTRRITVRSGLTIYLVVTTPTPAVRRTYTYPALVWPASLGDQVSLVAVRGTHAIQNTPVPAVDLDNATQFARIGPTTTSGSHGGRAIQVAQIVPDGVTRVRWRYGVPADQFIPVRTTAVADNVALAPAHRVAPRTATWLTAAGTAVHTSTAVARRLALAEQRQEIRLDVGALKSSRTVAAPALLHGFAVFNDGGPSRFTRDGVTVTRPRLSDIPVQVLDDIRLDVATTKLEPGQTRAVTTRSGGRLWVTPGATGMCLYVLAPNLLQGALPGNLSGGPGSTSACSATAADALSGGMGFATGFAARGDYAAGILPRDEATTTVRGPSGRRRTIRPPLGVYFVRIARP